MNTIIYVGNDSTNVIHVTQYSMPTGAEVVSALVIGIVLKIIINTHAEQWALIVVGITLGRGRITGRRRLHLALVELGASKILIGDPHSRIQFNCLLESSLRGCEVALGRQRISTGKVALGGVGREFHQPVAGFPGDGSPVRPVLVLIKHSMNRTHFRKIQPRANEPRILVGCFLEHFAGQFSHAIILRHCVAASAQEIFVGFGVMGIVDVILDGEYIVEFAIIVLRPQVRVRHANTIAGLTYATLKYVLHVEFSRNLFEVDLFALQ